MKPFDKIKHNIYRVNPYFEQQEHLEGFPASYFEACWIGEDLLGFERHVNAIRFVTVKEDLCQKIASIFEYAKLKRNIFLYDILCRASVLFDCLNIIF